MKRVGALPVLVALAAACGGGEVNPGTESPAPTATPTPTVSAVPSPTPTPSGVLRNVVLTSSGGGLAHAGNAALLRLKAMSGEIACDWVRIDGGDPFAFTISSAGVLEQGKTYDVVELVLGADANIVFNEGVDHALAHPPVTLTTDLLLTFLHDDPPASGWMDGGSETALPPGFSWADGTGCPGESQ